MMYFFRRAIPEVKRVLLVESGSRTILEKAVPSFVRLFGSSVSFDLLTCFSESPNLPNLDPARVHNVNYYPGLGGRLRLLRALVRNRYTTVGIICSGEPLLAKWKWMVVAAVPAKVFILNENADFFWLDYAHLRVAGRMVLLRSGLSGSMGLENVFRLLLFPFTFLYLLLYAAVVHLRRRRVHT